MMYDLVALIDAGLQPWLTIHDEVIVECDEADAHEVSRLMASIMSRDEHPILGVPIRVDGGVLGRAWRKA
ncbi:MAG: hypothetical protein M3Q22_07070 [Actinomycetota bacterium]|nr:hypothetical protein [Actinomycetota bacterium]